MVRVRSTRYNVVTPAESVDIELPVEMAQTIQKGLGDIIQIVMPIGQAPTTSSVGSQEQKGCICGASFTTVNIGELCPVCNETTVTTPTTPTTPPITTPIVLTEPKPKDRTNEVTLTQGVWELTGDRITGETIFLASQSFNPDLYGVNLQLITQIKRKDGATLLLKNNNLRFWETERDERITIDERAFGEKELIINQFVWSQDDIALSKIMIFTLREGDPPEIPHEEQGGNTLETFVKALPLALTGLLFLRKGLK